MNGDRHTYFMIVGLFATATLIGCSTDVQPQTGGDAGVSPSPALRVLNASPYTIATDEELSLFVQSTAEAAVAEHCVQCHGEALEGGPDVPNLVDAGWMWGITGFESNDVEPVMEIQQTLLYGIRNLDCPEDQLSYGACPDTRYSEMPGYGGLGFTEEQVSDLVEYVVNLSGAEADAEAVARAEPAWANCIECHGEDGWGYAPYGGPALADDIWLYGDDRARIADVITNGRSGQCPPWSDELDAATIKALAVYIWNRSKVG